jgi:hypothetical protein
MTKILYKIAQLEISFEKKFIFKNTFCMYKRLEKTMYRLKKAFKKLNAYKLMKNKCYLKEVLKKERANRY